MMKVFAFEYSHCIYDSGFFTVSMHSTKAGAYKAMMKHKNERWYQDRDTPFIDTDEIGWMERWQIVEHEAVA